MSTPETATSSEAEEPLREALEAASRDLYYISESDEPIHYVDIGPATLAEAPKGDVASAEADLRAFLKLPKKADIEPRDFDLFFEPVTAEEDWLDEQGLADAERFQHLVALLHDRLTDLQVLYVSTKNDAEFDAYVLGLTPEKHWAGLKTLVVET